jgi:hypothetical protein
MLADIMEKLKQSDDIYSLDRVLPDLYQLYLIGSVRSSVTDLTRSAQQQLQDATRKLEAATKPSQAERQATEEADEVEGAQKAP